MDLAEIGASMVWTLPRTVITIPEVLSVAECSDHVVRSEQIGYEAAPVITFRAPR
jgi:hypothetical protein